MHIWTIEQWKRKYSTDSQNYRTGLRLRMDRDVDPEVKRACKEFFQWLRKEYFFPFRIPVYVKASARIKAKDGDMIPGRIILPYDWRLEPYITVAAGDYDDLLKRRGKDNALAEILFSIAHELTHYFQWINDIELTERGMEWQATHYSILILDEYAETREHP